MVRIDQVVALLTIAADLKKRAESASQARQGDTVIPQELLELEEEAFAAIKAIHELVSVIAGEPGGNADPLSGALPETRERRP